MSSEVVHSPAVDRHARKPDIHLEIFIWGSAAVVLVSFLVACFYYAKGSKDLEWLYVTSILGLPLLQVPIVILMLRRNSDFWAKGALILLPALACEVLLWLAFTFRDICKSVLGLAAVTGLGMALFLGAVVFWVTGLIIGMADGRGVKFRALLRDQPFLVVCFFLTIFTFITLFLSLSLALHDQNLRLNHKTYALYAEDLGPAVADPVEGPDLAVSPRKPFKILFAQGSAAVESSYVSEDRLEEETDEDLPLPDDPVERRRALNSKHLDRLTQAILQAAEKDQVRIVLAGYSDDRPVDSRTGSYKSNFELSQARIHQVMVTLVARLERSPEREWRRNIEWLTLPSGNEKGFLDGRERKLQEERLAVEVVVLPSDGDRFSHQPGGKDLSLLDYVYFGVYTITTTGYGDIIPVSAYAKFVTTVANFFEVFLIVVFFNVLLSFLREEHEPAKVREAEAGKAAA